MTSTFRYSHTSVGGPNFDIDLGSVVPIALYGSAGQGAQPGDSLVGVVSSAAAGNVGMSGLIFDDPNGTVGYNNDGIKGLRRLRWIESTCPAGNDVVWNGYAGKRRYLRGLAAGVGATGISRRIQVELQDDNAILSFRSISGSGESLTGTMAKTIGSQTIVGTGTLFSTELVVGQEIAVPGGGGTDTMIVRAITDNTHLTVGVALTGTVSKTASSTAVTGSGTAFDTELVVGQSLVIPGGGGNDVVRVKTITDATHIVVQIAPTHSASGQTVIGGAPTHTASGQSSRSGAPGKRPAETGGDRLRWLLASPYSSNVEDDGLVQYPTWMMDAKDYTDQYMRDVLADIALPGNYSWFARYNQTHGSIELGFYDPNSDIDPCLLPDGVTTPTISGFGDANPSASNPAAQTIFAPHFPDGGALDRDPSRMYAGVTIPYRRGRVYLRDNTIADEAGYRDGIAPMANVSTASAARAIGQKFQELGRTEDDRGHITITVPAPLLTSFKQGQWLWVRIPHWSFPDANYSILKRWRIVNITRAWTEANEIRSDFQLELTPITVPAVVQHYTKTLDLGCFASTWPLAPGAGNMMIDGEVTRGASAPYTSINVPIGSTQAPNTSCSAPSDVPGTEATFVRSIMLDVGGNTCPMTLAWRIGVPGEPQVDRWQVSNRQRGHWIEMAGLDPGGPTLVIEGVTQNGSGSVFPSDALPSPGAGWWIGLGGYMSDGPQDHLGSGDIVLQPRAPAQNIGLVGWTVGDDAGGYRPYSWMVALQVFGAGTDRMYLDLIAGTPNNPGADFRWLCMFIPTA